VTPRTSRIVSVPYAVPSNRTPGTLHSFNLTLLLTSPSTSQFIMNDPEDVSPGFNTMPFIAQDDPTQSTATTSSLRLRPTTLQPWVRGGYPTATAGAPQTSQEVKQKNAERWRVPTILVLTISVALGIAMIIFLMWVAYRKVKKLRTLRRQEMAQRQRRSYMIRRDGT